jgi:hypothetical protein
VAGVGYGEAEVAFEPGESGVCMEAGIATRPAICTDVNLNRHRSRTIRRTVAGGVLAGLWCGREDRSANPLRAFSAITVGPHLRVGRGETMNIWAAVA